jgi:hypothetical protein
MVMIKVARQWSSNIKATPSSWRLIQGAATLPQFNARRHWFRVAILSRLLAQRLPAIWLRPDINADASMRLMTVKMASRRGATARRRVMPVYDRLLGLSAETTNSGFA